MTALSNLSQAAITVASQLPFYDVANGGDRRASVASLIALIAETLALGDFGSQYASPQASNFSVVVAPPTTGASVFLKLSPAGAYAVGSVSLPSAVHDQEVLVHCTQAVTTFSVVAAAGDVVSGAPTTLAAASFFRLKYDAVTRIWYRIA